MADSHQDEVSLLEETRARLETTLAMDENWRALVRGRASASDEDAAARRARDTRLEMALADNGVYCAWCHVGEAIDALRGYQADAGALPASPHSELPPDIAELIRRRAAEEERAANLEQHGKPSAAAAPPPTPEAGPARDLGTGVARQKPLRQEAAVTFVTREPAAAGVERTEKRLPLRDRLRDIGAEPRAQAGAFRAPKGGNEEADVTILTAEAIQQRALAERKRLTVARFRKALLGE